jgi:hypothetical protein
LRTVLIFLSAVTLAACSSSTGPTSYQKIAGQYSATFTYQLVVSGNTGFDSTVTVPATITMNDANSIGTFTGYTVFTAADSGVIAGQFGTNNAITWYLFGDPSEPLMYSAKVFSATYPMCNFADSATYTLSPGGGIVGKQLTLSATFTGFKCGADSASSTLQASVSATNTTGPT